MVAVKAYYDGQNYVTEENVAGMPNQNVIITFLEDFVPKKGKKSLDAVRSYMGDGKSIPDGVSAVDYVRSLRAEDGQNLF